VIDSIGRDVDVIIRDKYYLESIGYSVYMVMVYSDLKICVDRVENRERSYDKKITIKSWYDAYSNIVTYKRAFKDKFMLIQTDLIEPIDIYIKDFLQ